VKEHHRAMTTAQSASGLRLCPPSARRRTATAKAKTTSAKLALAPKIRPTPQHRSAGPGARWHSAPPEAQAAIREYRTAWDWNRAPGGARVHAPIGPRDRLYYPTNLKAFRSVIATGEICAEKPQEAPRKRWGPPPWVVSRAFPATPPEVSLSRAPGVTGFRLERSPVTLVLDPNALPKHRPVNEYRKDPSLWAVNFSVEDELLTAGREDGSPLVADYEECWDHQVQQRRSILAELHRQYPDTPGLARAEDNTNRMEERTLGPVSIRAVRGVLVDGRINLHNLRVVACAARKQGWPVWEYSSEEALRCYRAGLKSGVEVAER
jgi:hypothetical protein